MAFDTHAAAKDLERAGFTEAQVEALIDVTRRTTTLPDVSTLASKADLAELKAELKGDISSLKAELKGDISSLKAELRGDISNLQTSNADLRTEISAAKLQAITIFLSGMALITATGTVLSKLLR